MSSKDLNAKVVFDSDNKGLARGAKQAKQDLKDFGKTSDEVIAGLGDAFGVSSQKLQQLGNAAREMGNRLAESGNTGAAAFGKVLQSINAAKLAIAGLGIGAVVSAFRMLNSEAENFRNTIAGARLEASTAAYMETYSQVLHDFNEEAGRGTAEFEDGWKKAWGRFKENFRTNVVSLLSGKQTYGSLGEIAVTSLIGTPVEQQARGSAERAAQLAEELFDYQRQLQQKSVEWQRSEAQIAELRRQAKDDTIGLAAQQQAVAQAQALITQRYNEELEIRENIATRAQQISDLASDSVEAENATLAAAREVESVREKMQSDLKSLDRDQRSISASAAAEAEARRKAAEAAEKQRQAMEKLRAGVAGTNLSVSEGAAAGVIGQATTMQIGAVIKPTYDPKQITDISKEIASLVEQGVASVSESLGTLIGDLASGGDAWHNFASNALSAFGDMAISVGKMAIATGTATLGIKAALESLNGYVAIAAGAALVALGTAVKTGLSNVASGNYSASSSVASPSFSGAGTMGGGYATSALKVEISGKLTASGKDLEYVFDENNKRKKTVT